MWGWPPLSCHGRPGEDTSGVPQAFFPLGSSLSSWDWSLKDSISHLMGYTKCSLSYHGGYHYCLKCVPCLPWISLPSRPTCALSYLEQPVPRDFSSTCLIEDVSFMYYEPLKQAHQVALTLVKSALNSRFLDA